MSNTNDLLSNEKYLFEAAQKVQASKFLLWLEDVDANPEVLNRDEITNVNIGRTLIKVGTLTFTFQDGSFLHMS